MITQQPIASTKHTLIVIAIFLAIFLAGLARAGSSAANASPSHLKLYLGGIAAELALIWYIRLGVRKQGKGLRELVGPWPASPSGWAAEIVIGLLFAVTAHYLMQVARAGVGLVPDHTSMLLPRGAFEMLLWVVLSVTAGVAEELAFRGYLQKQFTAWLRSPVAAGLAQATIFGISHGYQGAKPILITAVFALLAVALTLWRRNLYSAMIGHAAIDIFAGLS